MEKLGRKRSAWGEIDRILRGEATRPASLARGAIDVGLGRVLAGLIVLGMAYGMCMGSFALLGSGESSLLQFAAATLKVPMLFVLTLAITLPSLYVFNALVGSRLTPDSVLRLLVATLAVMMTVLASMGTIVFFFSLSTKSYPFMVLLNVVVFAVSGFLGLNFLLQTMHRLSVIPWLPTETAPVEPDPAAPGQPPGALDPLEDRAMGRQVKLVFRCWIVLFGVVGAQMGWVLRPFIGNPALKFTWFRGRDSNFFQGVLQALAGLFS